MKEILLGEWEIEVVNKVWEKKEISEVCIIKLGINYFEYLGFYLVGETLGFSVDYIFLELFYFGREVERFIFNFCLLLDEVCF